MASTKITWLRTKRELQLGTNFMAQVKSEAKSALPAFDTARFVSWGQKQADTFVETQREICNWIEHMSRGWLSYAELERDLASSLGRKLAATDDPSEAMKAYQDWAITRTNALTERSKEFWSTSQKFTESATRLFSTLVKDASA
jgi:hypothetical protein